ncbi:MAG: alanine--glyoxylate aminotransferase family protein [Actinomycetota bacterium]|nr:alanine--glyoxylate aminotransferase family protein [Actinomycetota bacterium]
MNNPLEPGRFFLPGPTEVHPSVLEAQAQAMIGHRGPGIQELMERLDRGLRPLFLTERPVFVSTSSATGLMEAAVRNGVLGGRVLSLVNGAFSSRFAEIGRTCGFDVDEWEVNWGTVHSAEELSDRLDRGSYEAVTLSQSETSTGALQDLEAISEVVGARDETLLLVDSVTGIPGVETHTDDWGIDFILTGSQKALALPPGLAFGVASDQMMERSAKAPARGWYFALDRLMKQLLDNQTPATPAVSLLYALDVQLARIAEEGMRARWDRHLAMQARTMEWIDEMSDSGVGIRPYAEAGHRSPTVTTIAMPENGGGPAVVREMRDRGWVIGGGYGKIKDETIRIGHMGDHTLDELNELLDVLGDALR